MRPFVTWCCRQSSGISSSSPSTTSRLLLFVFIFLPSSSGGDRGCSVLICFTISSTTQLDQEWNKKVPETADGFVHKMIEAQAVRAPDQVAVASWDGELTYAELEHLASKLARHLAFCGVGPEDIVPICMHKSLWVIVYVASPVASHRALGMSRLANDSIAKQEHDGCSQGGR